MPTTSATFSSQNKLNRIINANWIKPVKNIFDIEIIQEGMLGIANNSNWKSLFMICLRVIIQTPRNDKSTLPAASCFHLFLGVWIPQWNTCSRFGNGTSSLNPQSKLNCRKTNSCWTRIFHLTTSPIPTPLPKLIANSWYGFTSLLEATLTQFLT